MICYNVEGDCVDEFRKKYNNVNAKYKFTYVNGVHSTYEKKLCNER